MRRFCWVFLALVPASAVAHSHAEEYLGHHWEYPEYVGEIRFQTALMVAAIAAAALYAAASYVWRVKRCGR